MAISDADMENKDIPIEKSGCEKNKSKNLDDKINARIKIINAVEDAKKLEFQGNIGNSEECDSGRVNIWGNENMSFFLLKDDLMKDLDIFNTKDSQVIRIKDDQEMLEVSLDTSKYRPDELSINVGEGIITVEGKHEEQSEDGRKMVSRQFSRKYSLPAGAKAENVVSNLSSDGVLVITIDKRALQTQNICSNDNQHEMKALETRDASTNVQTSQLMKKERIPTNLRSNFFTDPFFKSNWDKHENVHHKIKAIFSPAPRDEKQKANKSISLNETKQENGSEQKRTLASLDKKLKNHCPRRWMLPALSANSTFDTFESMNRDLISQKDDQNMFEWKLDISEYEPEEVKVTVSQDCILVEGSHEEKSVEGKQILFRNFTKKYSLPYGVRQEDVISRFTSDQALIITAQRDLTDQHAKQKNITEIKTDNKPIIKDKKASDDSNNFEQNYKNANDDNYLEANENVQDQEKSNGGTIGAKGQLDESNVFSKIMENDNTIYRNVKIEQEKKKESTNLSENLTEKSSINAIESGDEYKNSNIGAIGVKMLFTKSNIASEKNDNKDNRTVNIEQNIDEDFKVKITDITNDDEESSKSGCDFRKVKIEQETTNKESEKKTSDNKSESKFNTGALGVKGQIMKPSQVSEARENISTTEQNEKQIPRNMKIEKDNFIEEQRNNHLIESDKFINSINNDSKASGLKYRNVKIEQEILNKKTDNKTESDINTEIEEVTTQPMKPKEDSKNISPIAHNERQFYRNIKIQEENLTEEQRNKNSDENGKIIEDIHNDAKTSGLEFRKVKIEQNTLPEKVRTAKKNLLQEENQKEVSENISATAHNEKLFHRNIKIEQENLTEDQRNMNSKENTKFNEDIYNDIKTSGLEFRKVKIEQNTLQDEVITPKMTLLQGEKQKEECIDTSLPNSRFEQFFPRQWRLPSNLNRKLDLFQTDDDQVIRMVDNQEKFEVSLDTSQYRPDELRVHVGEGLITVEGKHEKKSEDGRKMVSRQFSRKYSLPAGAESESVVSNLSSDGVLIITATKQSLKSQNEASMGIVNEDSRVPITMRYLFFDDPFFKSTWSDIDSIKENMFNESSTFWRGLGEDSLQTEKSMFSNHQSFIDDMMQSCLDDTSGWMFPRKWMIPTTFNSDFSKQMDLFQTKDSEVIRVKDDQEKFEVSLDTSQYRPDELRVNVGEGIITVEGKHEEKSEDGRKMVSRQFCRKYSLPAGAKAETVISNLSSDGVLVVLAPKEKNNTKGQRRVPIQPINC